MKSDRSIGPNEPWFSTAPLWPITHVLELIKLLNVHLVQLWESEGTGAGRRNWISVSWRGRETPRVLDSTGWQEDEDDRKSLGSSKLDSHIGGDLRALLAATPERASSWFRQCRSDRDAGKHSNQKPQDSSSEPLYWIYLGLTSLNKL